LFATLIEGAVAECIPIVLGISEVAFMQVCDPRIVESGREAFLRKSRTATDCVQTNIDDGFDVVFSQLDEELIDSEILVANRIQA
jgi:hypothetical protein